MTCDICTISVSVLSILVTVLLCWNIYTVIDVRKHLEKINKLELSIKELEKALENKANKKQNVPHDIAQRGTPGN
ncbi:MAG: hypothetical protein IJL48_07290 [Bacteroidales bacterium]|nr:hypothetical protein [Bacteroidales bacterium]